MFNLVTRAQALSNHVLTCSIIIAIIVSVVLLIQLYFNDAWSLSSVKIENITAFASLKNSYAYGSKNNKPKENSRIKFDLDADLTSLFNWNTKQIFVYLTATYQGKNSQNKVTYWDKIITSEEEAIIHLRDQRSKYSVWDLEDSFNHKEANLTLEWNVQPHVGFLLFGETKVNTPFTFAEIPGSKKAQRNPNSLTRNKY